MDAVSMRSQIRHRPINSNSVRNVTVPRSSRPSQILRRRVSTQIAPHDQTLLDNLTHQNYQRYQPPREADTYDDDQIAPGTRTGRMNAQRPRKHSWQQKHPLFYIGIGLGVALTLWLITTMGAAWYTTCFIDPAVYGPAHGQMISDLFGGGDSQSHPSKVFSINDAGRVLLVKFTADDPNKTQVITGPELAKINFPDPQGAEIAIQAGDFDHDGYMDVMVTIESTRFDAPFHRYSVPYILYGDGKGNLKQRIAQ